MSNMTQHSLAQKQTLSVNFHGTYCTGVYLAVNISCFSLVSGSFHRHLFSLNPTLFANDSKNNTKQRYCCLDCFVQCALHPAVCSGGK